MTNSFNTNSREGRRIKEMEKDLSGSNFVFSSGVYVADLRLLLQGSDIFANLLADCLIRLLNNNSNFKNQVRCILMQEHSQGDLSPQNAAQNPKPEHTKGHFEPRSEISADAASFTDLLGENACLRNDLQNALNDKSEVERLWSETDAEKKGLQRDLEGYKKRLEALETTNNTVEAEMGKKKEKIKELGKKIEELEGEIENWKEKLKEAQASNQNLTSENARLRDDAQNSKSNFESIQSQLQAAQSDLKTAQSNLSSAKIAQQQTQQALDSAKKECGSLQKERDKACQDLQAFQDKVLAVPIVAELNKQDELCRRLGMGDLPHDPIYAAQKVIVVLGQKKNVERLHKALKDACEQQQRGITASERALLAFAVDCFNLQTSEDEERWSLLDVPSGAQRNSDLHERSTGSAPSEQVGQMWLPAVVQGSDDAKLKVWLKALVTTI